MIESERMLLIPAEMKHFDAMRDARRLSRLMNCMIALQWDPFPGAMHTAKEVLKKNPHFALWWTYLFVHKEHNVLIGCGGYHGVPDQTGRVEIGYGIAPAYTNRGLATEAAQALVDQAFKYPEVIVIDAHTLPREVPSTSILKKVGFTFAGDKHDADIGNVWRWVLTRGDYLANLTSERPESTAGLD